MEPLDHDALARELMAALRGDRSREAFARRTKFSANALYAWESGQRRPPANALFRAARARGLTLEGPVGALFSGPVPAAVAEASPDDLPRLLIDALRAGRPVGELARACGLDRLAFARWARGARPRLADLLRVIGATSHRLLDFVAGLADPEGLDAVRERWRRLVTARRLAIEAPWTGPLQLALATPAYRRLPAHDDAWLAGQLGLPVEQVVEGLRGLVASGQVRRRGRRYVVAPADVPVAVTGDVARRRMRAWSARVAADRLEAGVEGAVAGFQVFTVGDAQRQALEQLTRDYLARVRELVIDAPGPPDHLMLANVHLMPLLSAG